MVSTKARSSHPKSTKRQRTLAKGKPLRIKCPYCGREMQFRSADGIYKENPQRQKLYVCSNYPSCDTYVRVKDGTFEPIGTPANGPLRALRDRTHKEFDKIWKMNIMSRESAYEWLAITCGVSRRDAHIGNFRETMCEKVINMSRKLIDNQNQFPNK